MKRANAKCRIPSTYTSRLNGLLKLLVLFQSSEIQRMLLMILPKFFSFLENLLVLLPVTAQVLQGCRKAPSPRITIPGTDITLSPREDQNKHKGETKMLLTKVNFLLALQIYLTIMKFESLTKSMKNYKLKMV